jgi:HK97 family phage major capsid protein
MSNPVLEAVKASRAAYAPIIEETRDLMKTANASDARSMRSTLAFAEARLVEYDARIEELKEQDVREAAAAKHNLFLGATSTSGGSMWSVGAEEVYRPDTEVSFFRDMRASRMGDWEAAERLSRNNAIRGQETRTGDMTTVAGAGGTFAPPLWLVDQWIALARPGRVTADLMVKQQLPGGISSINLPKVATGATTGVQATQNSALSDTAMTSTSVSSGITTIAGKQIVALQLVEQSGVAFDRVILGDLAADYAKQLDAQVISGTGANGQLRGLLNGASVGTTTYTTATPKVIDGTTSANSFYNRIVSAVNAVAVARYMPATAIVMHPTRWSWVLEALDTAGRPLVLTSAGAFNTLGGAATDPVAEGAAGSLVNLPVYTDANIPTNLGTGTNQDVVFVIRAPDLFLWETDLALQSFDATYADQMSVLYRASSYSACITDRFGPSVNVISGTGLVAPTL